MDKWMKPPDSLADCRDKHWFYLSKVSADVEEVEWEDVVLGSHHQSSFLLVQQEGVVRWAVGQAFERHKVVWLQHFCRERKKERKLFIRTKSENENIH